MIPLTAMLLLFVSPDFDSCHDYGYTQDDCDYSTAAADPDYCPGIACTESTDTCCDEGVSS